MHNSFLSIRVFLIPYLCYLVKIFVPVAGQVIQTRPLRVLICGIIRASSIDVTLQNVIVHVIVSGRVLQLFPRQTRDDIRRHARWVRPTRRNKTIQDGLDCFLWMQEMKSTINTSCLNRAPLNKKVTNKLNSYPIISLIISLTSLVARDCRSLSRFL